MKVYVIDSIGRQNLRAWAHDLSPSTVDQWIYRRTGTPAQSVHIQPRRDAVDAKKSATAPRNTKNWCITPGLKELTEHRRGRNTKVSVESTKWRTLLTQACLLTFTPNSVYIENSSMFRHVLWSLRESRSTHAHRML